MTKTNFTYNKIRNNIVSQYWKEGPKIDSERKLSVSLEVSRVTVKAAIQKLKDEGFLEYKGLVVLSKKPADKASKEELWQSIQKFQNFLQE